LSIVGGDLSKLNIPTEKALDAMAARNVKPIKQPAAEEIKYNPAVLYWEALKRNVEDKYGASTIYS
jgi:hypothetical protein